MALSIMPAASLRHWWSSRLGENVMALFGLQAVTMALPLLTLPYLLRVLGPENYGRVALAQALVQYFVLVTDYGFNLTATRRVSALRNDPVALGELVGAVTAIKLGLLAVCAVLLVVLVAVVPVFERDWPLYSGAYLAVAGGVVFPIWLLQGLQRMRLVSGCTVAAQLLALAAILMLVRRPSDFWLAATLQASAPGVAGLIALWVLLRTGTLSIAWPTRQAVMQSLAEGWHVFVSTAATSLYSNTNIIVLGLLGSPAAVGQFSAAEKLLRAVQNLISPLSQSVFPHVAQLCAQSERAALDFLYKFLRVTGAFTAILSICIIIFGPAMIEFLFGPLFSSSGHILQLMAPLILIVGISNVLGVQTMLNFGLEKAFSRILIASGLLNLVLLATLVPSLGARGAGIALVATELAVTTMMALALGRTKLLAQLLRRQRA
jgi:polysaccharide transporter, PST family